MQKKDRMIRQIRLILGISIFWLALSMLQDGMNTLVLPLQLNKLAEQQNQATLLGLLTFIGLLAGALVQPIAGSFSDRSRPLLGRKGFIGVGLILSLASLALFAVFQSLIGVAIAYLAVQVSASVAQAGQQGLIPDLVDERQRGLASGWKGFMDIGGAMIGFVILGQLLGEGRSVMGIVAIALSLLVTYLLAVLLTPEDRPDGKREQNANVSTSQAFHLDRKHDAPFVRIVLSRFLFLLGIYSTGRFLLFFVADRLGLDTNQAAEQAGMLLSGLALITILASPLTGWLADRIGRIPVMIAGAVLGAASAILLVWAATAEQILLSGGLMSLASAAFAGGSWALLTDWIPRDQSARYFGMANIGTAGAAAVAGLFGPLMDWADLLSPGSRYTVLFAAAALAFGASALPLRYKFRKEVRNVRERKENKGKESTGGGRLDVVSLPANPASPKENPHPRGGTPRL